MIRQLDVRNYRALRDVNVSFGDFHVLVGPNGSGKSTLLDALAFLRDSLNMDLREAIRRRASSLDELTFGGRGGPISFRVEFDLGNELPARAGQRLLYWLELRSDPSQGAVVNRELLSVLRNTTPEVPNATDLLVEFHASEGHVEYLDESESAFPMGGALGDVFSFGAEHPALGKLPPDPKKYPTALAVRSFLAKQVTLLNFIPSAMARPCPALEPDEFLPDGRNLARVAGRLLNPKVNGQKFDTVKAKAEWLYQLRLALPDLIDIDWAQRPDDRAEYLRLHFQGGLIVPSWSLSEGTLRMLGLTLPAFLPPRAGLHLIEEPENAVHPHAMEVIVSALRSIPGSQVLVTTHSPLVVDLVGKAPLLIFNKHEGAVQIRTAEQHPALQSWDGSPMLSALFSAGYMQ